jgi:SUMO ligase MMS21 Smc5/6 complex component
LPPIHDRPADVSECASTSEQEPLTTFLAHINVEDQIQYVLRCHLHIENKLNEIFDFYLPNPSTLLMDNMSFIQKLRLANSLLIIHDDEMPAFLFLNKLRNKNRS